MHRPRSSSNAEQPASSLDRWLARRGLRGNPFERWNAEHDRDLPSYFVDIGGFDEVLRLDAPCVVLARRGCGKTAQRQMLAVHCRPLDPGSPRLAVVYTYGGFERTLNSANRDIAHILPIHHVSALLHMGLTVLTGETSRDSSIQRALQGPDVASRLAAYVARFAPHLADVPTAETSDALDNLSLPGLLRGFSDLVRDVGLESCVVLVDGLDEFPLTAGDPARATAFLAPLLGTLALVECPGWAFKFFLPQELESTLRTCGWFRPDRLRISRIAWNEDDLQALIKQRLTHFSRRDPPYEALAQLCEDELAPVIDQELPALAYGLPRAALILADMLLRAHCEQPNPPELIAPETWAQVRDRWQDRHADFVMDGGRSDAQPEAFEPVATSVDRAVLWIDEQKGLVWLGEHDITNRIAPQDYRVLVSLYRHQGAVCDRDLLAWEAWLGKDEEELDAEGMDEEEEIGKMETVTDQAIAASIARLRRALGHSSPDEGYIETVRGRGYRLHPGGFGPSEPVKEL